MRSDCVDEHMASYFLIIFINQRINRTIRKASETKPNISVSIAKRFFHISLEIATLRTKDKTNRITKKISRLATRLILCLLERTITGLTADFLAFLLTLFFGILYIYTNANQFINITSRYFLYYLQIPNPYELHLLLWFLDL